MRKTKFRKNNNILQNLPMRMPLHRKNQGSPNTETNENIFQKSPFLRSSSYQRPQQQHCNNDDNNDENLNPTIPFLKNLSRFCSNPSLSLNNMFQHKWTSSGPYEIPSRSNSMFSNFPARSNRRSYRTDNNDAYITLSNPSSDNNTVVTDDELRHGQHVNLARFNLVPVSPPPTASTSTTNLKHSDVNKNQSSFSSSSSSSTTPLPHDDNDQSSFSQAGGHGDSFQIDGATLTKKVTDREASFYEAAQEGAWPTSLLPAYYGRVGNDAISIENLTYGYSKPCVVDLKMGIQTFENDEKSLFKKIRMHTLDMYTHSRSEGCRLEGLSMFRTLDKHVVNVKGSKRQTHSVSADVRVSLQDVLTFFLTDESGVRTDVALRFQTAVEQILEQFKKNNRYLFIGSSILLIYDNDNQSPHMRWARALRKLHTIAPGVRLSEDQISGLTRRTLCDVRMIDFAHTGPLPNGATRDEGYIRGLCSILRALKAIRVYRSKPIFSFRSAAIDMMEEQRAKSLAAKASSESEDGAGDFTFGTVLKELTAVSDNTKEKQAE